MLLALALGARWRTAATGLVIGDQESFGLSLAEDSCSRAAGCLDSRLLARSAHRAVTLNGAGKQVARQRQRGRAYPERAGDPFLHQSCDPICNPPSGLLGIAFRLALLSCF
jgi:hypothetical protein